MEAFDEAGADPVVNDESELFYRTDDPDVWGLIDVVRGRSSAVPQTIYKIAGDSASGVVGMLYPHPWTFVPIPSSRVGKVITMQIGGADDGQELPKGRILPTGGTRVNSALPTLAEGETIWDPATHSPEFEVELEDGTREVRREHSKGLLLGDYAIHLETTDRVKGSHDGKGTKRFSRVGYVASSGSCDCLPKAA